MAPVRLTYDDGTVLVEGDPEDLQELADLVTGDPRTGSDRVPAHEYGRLVARLEDRGIRVDDGVRAGWDLPEVASSYELRSYQRAALRDWLDAGRRGVLELPTGSGKTVIAIAAIERLGVTTLVVVPTLDLLAQWQEELTTEFGIEVGQYGDGERRHAPIAVATYDSAYLLADAIGDRYGFVVFDEVHHLGGERHRDIARLLAAPARLGLTATFERPDGGHETIASLVGPVVHERSAESLAGEHLAPYDVRRLTVELTPEERRAYERHQGVFTDYLARSNLRMRSGEDYRRLVMRSGNDPAAREALLAKQRAREIMLNSEAKLEVLEDLLRRHEDDRVIVFTAHNDLVYRISERFLVPAITHRTAAAERREVITRFRTGRYSRIVAANVLDEGVDVPDANVAIILAGSGSEREFIQRLGRILRPKRDGGRATLYEVVSAETAEEGIAARRR